MVLSFCFRSKQKNAVDFYFGFSCSCVPDEPQVHEFQPSNQSPLTLTQGRTLGTEPGVNIISCRSTVQHSGVKLDFGICSMKRKNGTTQEKYICNEQKVEGKMLGISESARNKENAERCVRRSKEKSVRGGKGMGFELWNRIHH